jgi:hypothetical protein
MQVVSERAPSMAWKFAKLGVLRLLQLAICGLAVYSLHTSNVPLGHFAGQTFVSPLLEPCKQISLDKALSALAFYIIVFNAMDF